jgi:hypothetical protein
MPHQRGADLDSSFSSVPRFYGGVFLYRIRVVHIDGAIFYTPYDTIPSMRGYTNTLIAVLIIAAAVISYGYLRSRQGTTLSFRVAGSSDISQTSASLRAVPPEGVIDVGDVVNLTLVVDSADQAMNAVAGTITYPSDQVEAVGISTSTSILEYWVQEPTMAASSSITFSGIVPTPGFTGSGGQILTVSFKTMQEGPATIALSNVQVLANDGQGTNILSQVIPTTLTVEMPPRKHLDPTDINGDGKVDFTDLSILIANWGAPKDPRSDINRDGVVDLRDLRVLLSRITL